MDKNEAVIRKYEKEDEKGWVRCRVLSFLDTAYYDNVLREKDHYENHSIELVAEMNNQIVGLIDVEYEINEGSVCSERDGLGGMIWHLAVHPDYQNIGIASKLLDKVEEIAINENIQRFEAWTRDDKNTIKWYEKHNFKKIDSYLHVYMEDKNEIKDSIQTVKNDLRIVNVFSHYVGENKEEILKKFKRVYECSLFEKLLIKREI